jgi:DNA processing protein
MAEKMLECGGLLTEFMSGTIPDRENFPKRNRIIAGLCDVTIVVEASIKGGALITAELANSYNRDVFAFPGRLNDEFSLGCNHLIKTNRANLITKSADIEYIMGWSSEVGKVQKPQLSLPINLTDDEKIISNVLTNHGSLAFDDLSYLTSFQQSKLVHILLGMEIQGVLISLPGKVYRLV